MFPTMTTGTGRRSGVACFSRYRETARNARESGEKTREKRPFFDHWPCSQFSSVARAREAGFISGLGDCCELPDRGRSESIAVLEERICGASSGDAGGGSQVWLVMHAMIMDRGLTCEGGIPVSGEICGQLRGKINNPLIDCGKNGLWIIWTF